jgi:hypothetical protein
MSENSEQDQVEQQGEWEAGEPAWVAAGSPEDVLMEGIGAVVSRHPELMHEAYAEPAVATAAHIARTLGDESLSTDPTILELAHVANQHAAQAEQAAQAQQPVDPAQQILDAGLRGRSVLPF